MASLQFVSFLTRRMSKHSVIVIGAGIAGLSAALHLVQNGITDVKILEAKNRIGGRVHTCDFGLGNIEMGASWIHGGSLSNSIYTLANQFDLLPDDTPDFDDYAGHVFQSSGTVIPEELSKKAVEVYLEATKGVVSGETTDQDTMRSVQNWREICFKKILNEIFEHREREMAMATFNCLDNIVKCFFGVADFKHVDLSLVAWYANLPPGPQNLEVPGGYKSILNKLSDGLSQDCLYLNSPVLNIALDDTESSAQKVKVECSEGGEFTADHVIVTVPLGHLKANHKTLFTPELPAEKQGAIERIGFGKCTKLFLQYSLPFWRHGDGKIKLGWTNEEVQTATREQWWRRLASFDEVYENPNVLAVLLSGPEGELMESLSQDVIAETVTSILRQFLKNPAIPKPCSVMFSKWCTDPFTLGSYSYPHVGNKRTDFEALRSPIHQKEKPVILFAGEATADAYNATVNGARDSGLREAESLLKFHGLKSENRI